MRLPRKVRALATGAALAVLAAGAGCVPEESGFTCESDAECEGMILLPGPCWESVCAAGRCELRPRTPGSACDDGDPCTAAEACSDGECRGGVPRCDDGVACTADACEPATGTCRWTLDDAACDDGDLCTADRCALSGCENLLVTGRPCDDSDPCTDDDRCRGSGCAGTPRVCDAQGPCMLGRCEPVAAGGVCHYTPQSEGYPCTLPAGEVCREGDLCDGRGHCGHPIDCGAAIPCQAAACEPGVGCVARPLPDGTPCQADGCRPGGACAGGECVGGEPVVCDDQNPCTDDACDPTTGACRHAAAAEGAPCDDQDPCTGGSVCRAGRCAAGTLRACGDDDPCTVDWCDGASGACRHEPTVAGPVCDDGNPCTGRDRCDGAGACRGTPLVNGAPCRFAAQEPCHDGVCRDSVCDLRPLDCDDGLPCTVDACDAAADACRNDPLPDGTPCGGDGACTVPGACAAGVCDAHVLADGSACNDGRACTEDDVCAAGACAGTAIACDDGDPCTADTCVEPVGCVSTLAPGAPCEDGDPCTGGDVCVDGACAAGAAVEECCRTDADCDDRFPASAEHCATETNRCWRAADGAFSGHCADVFLPGPDGTNRNIGRADGETAIWALDMEDPALPGLRVFPAGSWIRVAEPVYEGRAALAAVAPGHVSLPPVDVPRGLSSLTFRYYAEGDRDGRETSDLLVDVDGVETQAFWGNTPDGFLARTVFLAETEERDDVVLRLRFPGGPARVVVDSVRFQVHAHAACPVTNERVVPAAAAATSLLVATSAFDEARLLGYSGDLRQPTSVWTARVGPDGRPGEVAYLFDPDSGDDFRLAAAFSPIALAAAGEFIACPAADAGGARCFLGGRFGPTAPLATLPLGATLQSLGLGARPGGWLLAAAAGSDWRTATLISQPLAPDGATEGSALVIDGPGPLLAPQITRLSDGATAVVWLASEGAGCWSIRARRLPSAGVGDANATLAGADPGSAVCPERSFHAAALPSGGLALVWVENPVGGGEGAPRLVRQHFDAELRPVLPAPVTLAELRSADELLVSTAVADAHHALAIWLTFENDRATLRMSRYDPTGAAPSGEEDVPIVAPDRAETVAAAVTYLDSGFYAVASHFGQDTTVRLIGAGCGGYAAERRFGNDDACRRDVCVGLDGWHEVPGGCP